MESIKNIRGIKPGTAYYRTHRDIKGKEVCYICNKEFNKTQLEVEHEIPVCLGSSVYDFKLACVKCHQEKTSIDILIIYFLKKAGFLTKVRINEYETPIGIERLQKLQKLYLELFKQIKEVRSCDNCDNCDNR
jgi:hypothetical protein